MSKKTKVFESSFKGHPIFEVWPIDDSGTVGKYKTISFGITKAKAILENIEELKAFIAKHNPTSDDGNVHCGGAKPQDLGVEDVF